MLISYSRPSMTFTIAGTGASFVTPASALTNGRPADATRLQWLSGTQTTASTVVITATFASAISARCAALLMPNIATAIPAGVKVTIAGKLSGSNVTIGGNALTTRTVTLPNGASAVHWVFPAVSIDTLVITIYNDLNGSTWAAASQYVDLGEMWCGKGADFAITENMKRDSQGGLLQRSSHNNQQWALQVQPFRTYECHFVPMAESYLLGPLSFQDDFETVANALNTQTTCVIIPSYLNVYNGSAQLIAAPTITTATIAQQRLNRYFCLGSPDVQVSWTRNGDFYSIGAFTFGESPP